MSVQRFSTDGRLILEEGRVVAFADSQEYADAIAHALNTVSPTTPRLTERVDEIREDTKS